MTIIRNVTVLAAGALSVGLIASGCAKSAETPAAQSTSSHAAHAAVSADELKALVPTPANTGTSKGPDGIADNGIHLFYQVTGEPTEAMNAYKAALESKGWEVTTIVSSGSGGGGGGATFTGTHGDAYGVFDGGGFQTSTFIDVCTWPAKPANPNCQRGGR